MKPSRVVIVASLTLTSFACSSSSPSTTPAPNSAPFVPPAVTDARLPRTRAEKTNYLETSHYDDVIAFIDSLRKIDAPISVGSIGTTTENRPIPYVVASRPLVTTPDAARALGRPIVYVQGNIHAGEVEGKEALQALLRDLVFQSKRNVLDSIVLIAVPIYNADGNERFADQARNRGAQNGPELVGQRPNATGLDLNRDYIKGEAPETRASLAMFNRWNPDVFVDLHTTDGSYHGYALTYSPSLNPAGDIGPFSGGAYARDSILPELRRRVRERRGYETFDYGNFASQDSVEKGWFTYEHFPRYGTNYYALRGRISVLSEAFSHDPFNRRVASTYAFVAELLTMIGERGPRIRALSARSDSALAVWGRGGSTVQIPIRGDMTKNPYTGDVLVETLQRTGDSVRTEPGVRIGFRRTGQIRSVRMPVYDRFVSTMTAPAVWGYAFPEADTSAVRLLRLHGVVVEQVRSNCSPNAESFVADSVIVAGGQFRNARVEGRWHPTETRLRPGTNVVRVGQPLGVLATYLLEPRSDDGLVAWNIGGRVANNQLTSTLVRFASPPPADCGTRPS
jgi:hypothetical protein